MIPAACARSASAFLSRDHAARLSRLEQRPHQLGTGLGFAIGAKVAAPDKFCVNFMGDAAFGMTGLDFETAVRCGIPHLTIVLNNSTMAIEIPHMKLSHDKHKARDLGGNYAALARELGGWSERVADPNEAVVQPTRSCAPNARPRTATPACWNSWAPARWTAFSTAAAQSARHERGTAAGGSRPASPSSPSTGPSGSTRLNRGITLSGLRAHPRRCWRRIRPIGCVVLTGGGRAFCSGGDVRCRRRPRAKVGTIARAAGPIS